MKLKIVLLGGLIFSLSGCGGFSASSRRALITLVAPTHTNQLSVEVSGKCEMKKDELPVIITGNFTGSPLSVICEDKAFVGTVTLYEEQTNLIADQYGETAEATIIYDIIPPDVALTFPVPSGVIGSNVFVSGTCETGTPLTIDGDLSAPVTTACENNQFYTNLIVNLQPDPGSRQLTLTQTDLAGNVGTFTADYTFDNSVPGNPSLTLEVENPHNSTTPPTSTDNTPELTGSVANAVNGVMNVFENASCSGIPVAMQTVPGSGDVTVNITYVTTGEDDGLHRYYARALGANGVANPGGCINTNQAYRLDTQPPAVRITSHADGSRVRAGTYQTIRGECENGLPLILNVESNDYTLTCSNRRFSRAMNFPNDPGILPISATQTDLVGNTITVVHNVELTEAIDNSPPEVSFLNLFANDELMRGQVFSLSGLCEADYPVTISGTALVGPTQVMCTSAGVFSADISIVATPSSSLTVIGRQVDGAQNAAQVTVRVRVINPPEGPQPNISILSPLAGSDFRVNGTIIISGLCRAGIPVHISGEALATTYSATCTGSGVFSLTAAAVSEEAPQQVITARQTDQGETGEFSTTVNIIAAPENPNPTPPPVKLTTPTENDTFNINSAVLVSGTCAIGLPVSISGSGLTEAVQAECSVAGTFMSIMQVGGEEGNRLSVTASQINSNGDLGLDLVNINILSNPDITPPNVSITAPANGSTHNVNSIVTVGGACENGIPVHISGTALSGPQTATCSGSSYSQAVPFIGVVSPTLSIIVHQTDAQGNSNIKSRSVKTVAPQDTQAPEVFISSPINGGEYNRGSLMVVSGQCEAGLQVRITGNALQETRNTVCTPSGSFAEVLQLSDVPAPGRSVQAAQTDAASNTGQALAMIDIVSNANTTAPAINISTPAENSTHQSGSVVTIGGSCTSNLPVALTGSGLTSDVTTACSGGSFSVGVALASAGGNELNIIGYQTDAIGNMGVSVRKINLFSIPSIDPPNVSIEFPIASSTFGRGATIMVTGRCEPGYQVQLSGTALSRSAYVNCSPSGGYSHITTVRSSSATNASIVAGQRDGVGRYASDYVLVNVSAQPAPPAPPMQITNPLAQSNIDAGLNFIIQGTCDATGSVVYILGTAVNQTSTVNCNSGGFSFNARAVSNVQANATISALQLVGSSLSMTTTTVNVTRPVVPVPPVVDIVSPANNASIVQGAKVEVHGTCTPGIQVRFTGTALTSQSSTSCKNDGTFSREVTVVSNTGTGRTIIATQTNSAGQASTSSRNINILTTPVLHIASPLNGSSFTRNISITVEGECKPGVNVQISGSALTAGTSVPCSPAGTYASNVTLVNTVSSNLKIQAKQFATIEYDVTHTVTINTIDPPVNPIVTILDPMHDTAHPSGGELDVIGRCEPGFNVRLSGTAIAAVVNVTCATSGTYAAKVNLVALPEPEEPEEPEDPPEDPPEDEEDPEEDEPELRLRASQTIGTNTGHMEISLRVARNAPRYHCGNSAMRACSAAGYGRESNPYIISNLQCLKEINSYSNLSCHYRLGAHINASSTKNNPWEPIGDFGRSFTGSFDGAGRSIRDLYINHPYRSYVGLFGRTNGATIKNVKIEDVEVSGYNHTGAVVGYGVSTYIENVTLMGIINITGNPTANVTSSGVVVGGIAGSLGGEIRNSQIDSDDEIIEIKAYGGISSGYSADVGHRVGGFVGQLVGSMRDNKVMAALRMTVTGNISISRNTSANAGHRVGGFVGTMNADSSDMGLSNVFINNQYDEAIAAATVVGDLYISGARGLNGHKVGGLIGENGTRTIQNSYIYGSYQINVGGDFIGSATGNDHRLAGHTVGGIIGVNLNNDLFAYEVYTLRPQFSPSIEAQVPPFELNVGGNGGIHSVGGVIGETIKASFHTIYAQGSSLSINAVSNSGNHVGGLIGNVYSTSYSDPKFQLTFGYIAGLNSTITADSKTGFYGNRIGGLIGRIGFPRIPSGLGNNNGAYLFATATDGFGQILSYGTNSQIMGGIVGQLEEPHRNSTVSSLRRSFVSETFSLYTNSKSAIVGGIIGEYKRMDGNEYTSSIGTVSRVMLIENVFSLASYDVPLDSTNNAALGFVMGRCSMGRVERSGVMVEISKAYGAPVESPSLPVSLPYLSGVVGVATGTGQGASKCRIIDSRYGHLDAIPAQACVGCNTIATIGLTEAQLKQRANFPLSWVFRNDTSPREKVWEITENVTVPFLIVNTEDTEPIEEEP